MRIRVESSGGLASQLVSSDPVRVGRVIENWMDNWGLLLGQEGEEA